VLLQFCFVVVFVLLVVVFISGAVANPLPRSRVSAFCLGFPVPFCFRSASVLVSRSLRSLCLWSSPFEQRYGFLSQDDVGTLASPKFSFTSPSLSFDVFFLSFLFVLEPVLGFFQDLFGAHLCRWGLHTHARARTHTLSLSLHALWSSRF
jgi:hypothetical protein